MEVGAVITKEQFMAYEAVRQSGKTNMFLVQNVQALLARRGVALQKEQIYEIMDRYLDLRAEFMGDAA